MAQYIDKTKVVAEIEKRMQELRPTNTHQMQVGEMDRDVLMWLNALTWVKGFLNTLEVKEVDLVEERMKECPYKQVGCTMYEGNILECRGSCSWVVDYLKLKELKQMKGGVE